jgi:hypothetical protein
MDIKKCSLLQWLSLIIVTLGLISICLSYKSLRVYDNYVTLCSNSHSANQSFNFDSIKFTSYFDRQCEKHGEWELLTLGDHHNLFFKRSAAFYFLDANLLRVHFVASQAERSLVKRSFILHVMFHHRGDLISVQTKRLCAKLHSLHNWSKYEVYFIDAMLDLRKYNLTKIMKQHSDMKLIIEHEPMAKRTSRALNVNVKYLVRESGKKRSAMHCGKCLHLKQKTDLVDLAWWLQLMRKAGYQKVVLCDHMIEKSPAFASLIESNKDLVEIVNLKCIPNMQHLAKFGKYLYLKNYRSLVVTDTETNRLVYDVTKIETIGELYYNECYLRNIDKFRHIAVNDVDELVIPKRIEKFADIEKFIDYISSSQVNNSILAEFSCKENLTIGDYLPDLLAKIDNNKKASHEKSIYFRQGHYIFNEIVEELFKELDAEFTKQSSLKPKASFAKLEIKVLNQSTAKAFKVDLPYTFTIESEREYNYAVNLLKLYKLEIEPFLKKNQQHLKQTAGNFDRLFFVTGEHNEHVSGKVVHNTLRTMDVYIHYAIDVINVDKTGRKMPWLSYQKKKTDDLKAPRNLAHLAHFRRYLNFDAKQTVMPITSFHFDLNYFKCFLVPLLQLSN